MYITSSSFCVFQVCCFLVLLDGPSRPVVCVGVPDVLDGPGIEQGVGVDAVEVVQVVPLGERNLVVVEDVGKGRDEAEDVL